MPTEIDEAELHGMSAADVLRSNPVFAKLGPWAMRRVAAAFRPYRVRAGEAIWSGDEADACYVVGGGGRLEVHLRRGRRLEKLFLSQGGVAGAHLWMGQRPPRWSAPAYTLRAVIDTVVYRATSEDLEPLAADKSVWPRWNFKAWYELLETDTLLSISPDVYDLLARQRLVLSELAVPVARQLQEGETLYDFHEEADGVYFTMYGGLIEVTRRDKASGAFVAEYRVMPSHLFGMECLYDSADEFRARARKDTWVWVMPKKALLKKALKASQRGWMRRALDRLIDHTRHAPQMVRSLLRHPLFRRYADCPKLSMDEPDLSALYQLLRSGQIRDWAVCAPPPPPIGAISGFGMVLEGEVVTFLPDLHQDMGAHIALGDGIQTTAAFGEFDVFGLETMLVERALAAKLGGVVPFNCFRARSPSRVLFINDRTCARLLGGQAPYEEGLREVMVKQWQTAALRTWFGLPSRRTPRMGGGDAPTPERFAELMRQSEEGADEGGLFIGVLTPEPTRRPAMVLVEDLRARAAGYPASALTLGAARSIHRQFDEAVVVLDIEPGHEDLSAVHAEVWDADCGIFRAVARVPDDFDAVACWLGAWAQALDPARTPWLLIHVSPDLPQVRLALAFTMDRVAYVAASPTYPLPRPFPKNTPYTYLAILEHEIGDPAGRGHTFPPGATRLRMAPDTLAGWAPTDPPQALWDRLKGHDVGIDRFARALTDRRVGVALGGGGSWGMAHVAILRGLHRAGIPVDLVAGPSVGATVGAYYAALGLEGLELILERRFALQAAAVAGLVTLEFFRKVVNEDLGGRCLEELDLPFFPVATDLLRASPWPLMSGSLGEATRKSGSLPPVYSETNTGQATFIDGGFSANLPVAVLENEGARLLIASDIIPPLPRQPPRPPRFEQLIGRDAARLLSDINVPRRFTAIIRGSLSLFHNGGNSMAARAPVHFDSAWTGTLPENLAQGPEIIDDTLGSEGYWQALRGAEVRWQFLKQRPYRPPM